MPPGASWAPLCVSLHDSWFANENFVKPEYHWSLILFTRLIAGTAATRRRRGPPWDAGRDPLYPRKKLWARCYVMNVQFWIFAQFAASTYIHITKFSRWLACTNIISFSKKDRWNQWQGTRLPTTRFRRLPPITPTTLLIGPGFSDLPTVLKALLSWTDC